MTSQQARLLQFIVAYQRDHAGVSPSYQEMADGIGVRSKSNVPRLLLRLEEAGYIVRGGRFARSIRVTRQAPGDGAAEAVPYVAEIPGAAGAAGLRPCNVIAAEIAKLLPVEARLKQLRIELGRSQSRDRLIAMHRDPAVQAKRAAGLALAMKGNRNGIGHRKSPETRQRIAAKMKGNTNCVGRNSRHTALAREAAQKRGILILPSPAPDLRGLSPDYAADRMVFYTPDRAGA